MNKGKTMFKKIIFSAVILLSVVSSVFAAEMKIGIFDERLVLSKIPQVEQIDAKLKEQFKDRIDELNALRAKGLEMQEKYTRDSMTMTDDQKIKMQRDLTKLGSDLKSKDKNLKEDFQRANQTEINKIRVKVSQTVNKIAIDEKFDVILRIESAAYRKESIDISNKVITILSNPAAG